MNYTEIKWKAYMLKLHEQLLISDTITTILKIKHCNKGFHHMKPDYLTVQKSTKNKKYRTIINVKFFECEVCGLKRFHNKKDKDKYEAYFQKKKKEWNKIFTKLSKQWKSK